MNVFYNPKFVGDVLMIQLAPDKSEHVVPETCEDIVVIHDEKTNNIVGFNIFNASSYASLAEEGQIELTESLVQQIQTALEKNGVEFKLEVDLSPKFVVGHVQEVEAHPNADKLKVCKVDVGEEVLQIVCGAKNIAANQYVVVAKVGAVMPSGMIIRDAQLRGVDSSGMICSASELQLPNAKENVGILVLDQHSTPGEAFQQ